MKIVSYLAIGLIFAVLALPVFANGQYNGTSSKQTTVPPAPKYKSYPQHYKPISATLYAGSLLDNLSRIAKHYGWNNVVWTAPEDYVWVGTTHVTATDLPSLFGQILHDYPLQAVFYQGNRVLLIQPRTLR